jgi:hypothetical protein
MYIASYSTYISPFTQTKRGLQKREEFSLESGSTFQNRLQNKEEVQNATLLPTLSLSKYTFSQQRETRNALSSFEKFKNYQDAQSAYQESSQFYSLAQKPKFSLSTPVPTLKLPKEAQVAKETLSKQTMINTYIENDNYYRITAA